MDDRVAEAARSWPWDNGAGTPGSNLPLLDLLRSAKPRAKLDGWDVLLIQHHLETFLPLVGSLLEDGMLCERSWHVDIPYSTTPQVNGVLRERWPDPLQMPPLFNDPLADYTQAQLLRVSLLLKDLAERPQSRRRLLVIDDGAYFARCMLGLQRIGRPEAERLRNCAIVEQTTRGHLFLQAHKDELQKTGLNVVSIARTKSKIDLEGPFIGAAVAAAISRSRHIGHPARIGVLGYGVIGESVTHALEVRFPQAHITIIDKRAEALRRALRGRSGRTIGTSLSVNEQYDLLVGCTGTNSFKVDDRQLLADGAVLASGSSAAIEFDRAGFVDLADYYPDDEIEVLDRAETRAAGIHADIRFRFEGRKEAVFLNAGFPVNFDGESESLAPHMIQGTRCLLYAAATQATSSPQPGLTTLSAELDNWIYHNALRFL
jgi:hypothetical protein